MKWDNNRSIEIIWRKWSTLRHRYAEDGHVVIIKIYNFSNNFILMINKLQY